MKVFRISIPLFSFLAAIGPASAEQITRSPEKKFEGIIQERGWQKSLESYCHGGSDYFVLKTTGETIPLGSKRIESKQPYSIDDFKNLRDRKLIVIGSEVSFSMKYKDHCPPEQQCIANDITCSFIEVREIKVLD